MNKEFMKGIQKQKKSYLRLMDCKMVTAIMALHLNGKARENDCIQRKYCLSRPLQAKCHKMTFKTKIQTKTG